VNNGDQNGHCKKLRTGCGPIQIPIFGSTTGNRCDGAEGGI
jgi:hypothetical protein